MKRDRYLKDARSVVIKVGTSVLTRQGRFDRTAIQNLSKQFSFLLKKGKKLAVVSSGAIGAGMSLMKFRRRPKTMQGLQAAAAVGQRYLMQCYEEAFSRNGYSTAQVLLTWDDVADERRCLNARRTLREIQKWRHVPIINENDTVATDEIRFGDNDTLSALIAILIGADALIILSDTDGLYAGADRSDAGKRFTDVPKMSESIYSHASDKKNRFTVGGMTAKLKAIHKATGCGIPVALADGRERGVLMKLYRGEAAGTLFRPETGKKSGHGWLRKLQNHTRR